MSRSLISSLVIAAVISLFCGPLFSDPAEDLMQSIYKGNIQGVKSALDKGVDPNKASDKVGTSALSAASYKGNVSIMKLLIEKGATIEDTSGYLGETPLMNAAQSGNIEAVKLLLEKGASMKARSQEGKTVLMFAAMGGNPAIVKLAAEKGVDVNAQDKSGWTALMHAAVKNKADAAKELISLKADLNRKSISTFSVSSKEYSADFYPGDTALTVARVTGRTQVAKMLEAAGARSYSEEIFKKDELYKKLGLYRVEMGAASKGDFKECIGILKQIFARDPDKIKEIDSLGYNDDSWFVVRIQYRKKQQGKAFLISLTDARGKVLVKKFYAFTQTAGSDASRKYRDVILLQSAEPINGKKISADRSPISLTATLLNTSKKVVRFYVDGK